MSLVVIRHGADMGTGFVDCDWHNRPGRFHFRHELVCACLWWPSVMGQIWALGLWTVGVVSEREWCGVIDCVIHGHA